MRRPNILFLHVDQLNLFAIGANGCRHVATPNLDRLYARGVSFRHSCVANPVCGPSRTCWYTGLMSEEHGQLNNWPEYNMDPSIEDIGPLIRRGGYDSLFMGKWHLTKPIEKSFDLLYGGHWHGELGDAYTARAAEAFLTNRDDAKPFFLNVGFLNPHDCCMWFYHFSPCGPGKFSLAPELAAQLPPLPPNHYLPAYPTVDSSPFDPTHGIWTDLDWRYYLYCYYRQVEMVDAEVGRVLDALDRSKSRENTVIVFASDHGDGLAQHYHFGKACLFDHSVMAPLVVVDPAMRGRRDTTHMVSSIDVTATICDYAGVDPLPGRKGLSLRPLVEGKSPDWRPYAASAQCEDQMAAPPVFPLRLRMIRTPDHKLIHDRVTNEFLLYDLAQDPWEMNNQAANPAYAQPLATMRDFMDRNEASYHYAPQTIRALQALEKQAAAIGDQRLAL